MQIPNSRETNGSLVQCTGKNSGVDQKFLEPIGPGYDSQFSYLLAMWTWASLGPVWESASLAMSGKDN